MFAYSCLILHLMKVITIIANIFRKQCITYCPGQTASSKVGSNSVSVVNCKLAFRTGSILVCNIKFTQLNNFQINRISFCSCCFFLLNITFLSEMRQITDVKWIAKAINSTCCDSDKCPCADVQTSKYHNYICVYESYK